MPSSAIEFHIPRRSFSPAVSNVGRIEYNSGVFTGNKLNERISISPPLFLHRSTKLENPCVNFAKRRGALQEVKRGVAAASNPLGDWNPRHFCEKRQRLPSCHRCPSMSATFSTYFACSVPAVCSPGIRAQWHIFFPLSQLTRLRNTPAKSVP